MFDRAMSHDNVNTRRHMQEHMSELTLVIVNENYLSIVMFDRAISSRRRMQEHMYHRLFQIRSTIASSHAAISVQAVLMRVPSALISL